MSLRREEAFANAGVHLRAGRLETAAGILLQVLTPDIVVTSVRPVPSTFADVLVPKARTVSNASSSKVVFVRPVVLSVIAPPLNTTTEPKRTSNVSVPGVENVEMRPLSKILTVEPTCSVPAGMVGMPDACKMLVAVVLLVSAVPSACEAARTSERAIDLVMGNNPSLRKKRCRPLSEKSSPPIAPAPRFVMP